MRSTEDRFFLTQPCHGSLLPHPTESLRERVLGPGKTRGPLYFLWAEGNPQSGLNEDILPGCSLSPVGQALAWKPSGKMSRQDKAAEIKDYVQLLYLIQD